MAVNCDMIEKMLFRKKKSEKITGYDPESKKPIIKASICNGEQVAGFKDLNTGAFEEIMLIKTPADLSEFRHRYGITEEIRKEY